MSATAGAGGAAPSQSLVDGCVLAAERVGAPLSSLLLAAHAKVHGMLTGASKLRTGLIGPDPSGPPRDVVLTIPDGPWERLIRTTHDALVAAPASVDGSDLPTAPMLALRRDSGVAAGSDRPDAVEIWMDDLAIRVPGGVNDADPRAAGWLVGYYHSTLAAMAADVDAPHDDCELVTREERDYQVGELAGPTRESAGRAFRDLFADRVRTVPAAVAASCDDRSWTYVELDRRADRIGAWLSRQGLGPEEVVAVVSERHLDWLASVVGIFKAGGCYLPVDPSYPLDRIAAMLSRGRARLLLADPAGRAAIRSLDAATAVELGALDAIVATPAPAPGSHRHEVRANGLAYIYFTSGSTGEPKGAMCEHAGMVNHVAAKIEELGIGGGTVVAQTAPQCFDISLWQLLAALATGGSTRIVEQDAIDDIARLVDTVTAGAVEVLQLVPSYLDVLLTYLAESGRELPSLRVVSATGEALKPELVRRWFSRFPTVPLVNAYGLTETSDDTNHETLREAPAGGVTLGRPIANVHLYLLDERCRFVPFGAPGEIYFSGVCVGRGYINDPGRTAAAFLADPHRPGQRMYRSGDFGRWRPDGRLEFLGRRDAQVKVHGLRIETGEIENHLLRAPGVRAAAVVVAHGPSGDPQVVGFYAGDPAPPADSVRAHLRRVLPAYLLPARLHSLDALPLTGNGKTDRKRLSRRAADLLAPTGAPRVGTAEPPRTPSERRLAEMWAQVLGIAAERVLRTDSFFELGGTSLTAVRLAIATGDRVTPRMLRDTPVLADLAAAMDGRVS